MTALPGDIGEMDETAWLIEFSHLGVPHYYGSDGEEGLGQTSDHLRAIRFARAEDAQAVIDDIGWTEAKPVEHMWTGSRTHPAPGPAAALATIIETKHVEITDGHRRSAPGPAGEALAWAVERWNAEVKNRPLVNVHRRSFDDTWRQVMRHFGGDPDALVGPSHDELLEKERGNER